jgi:LAGLIDADG endonuclease
VKIGKDTTRKFNLRIVPEFVIELHERDFKVLKEIKKFFNVGSLKLRIRDGKTTGIYSVQSIRDLTEVIIPHFKKYPLITQKQADFILFTLVVELIQNKRHLDEEGLKEIMSLKASINKGLSGELKTMFSDIKAVDRPVISSQEIKSPF